MIILRYLIRETLKSQFAVFLVLMAIFITQRFVRVLAEASDGDIPASLVMGFLALKMPVLAALILPLSFFLGMMLAHGRFYVDSEMTVIRACGVSEWYVARVMMLVALLFALLTGVLTLWLAPLAVETEYQMEDRIASEAGLMSLIPGRFEETANKNAVMFVHDISSNNNLNKVFLAQQDAEDAADRIQIVYAEGGKVSENDDGSQQLVLTQGHQYEGKKGRNDFSVVEFEEYQIQIGEQQAEQKRRKMTAFPTVQLIDDTSLAAIAEFQWRIAIPLSIPFLVLIAVPLSAVDPRQGRFGKIMPALLLYLGYFLLLMASRKVLEDGKIPPELGLWWVHGIILLIGATLIARDRTLGVKVRARVRSLNPVVKARKAALADSKQHKESGKKGQP